jgi:hypothetical protein
MPRVIVTTETGDDRERSILLSECVGTVVMASEQSSLQFLERLAWGARSTRPARRGSSSTEACGASRRSRLSFADQLGSVISTAPKPSSGPSTKKISIVMSGST